MQLLIITGLSGAGKTRVADILEDYNYYCVDNMPLALLPKFAEFCTGAGGRYENVALVADVRDRTGFSEIFDHLSKLKETGIDCRILFVEASPSTIVRRYKESRRPHPLQSEASTVEGAVMLETGLMSQVRDASDFVINTSNTTLAQLQAEVYRLVVAPGNNERRINVNVMSFGFKYGLPVEADMVFDVRFLPNPFYIHELRAKSGLDEDVKDYVVKGAKSIEFLSRVKALVEFLLPNYIDEGKHTLTIAVGCSGGRHRSVAVAESVAEMVKEMGQTAHVIHRDIDKG